MVLSKVGEDLWSTTRPMRFWGVETGTRMTVVRLRSGGLFVHSPVALDAPLRAAVDALGPVEAIVAPSRFHHMFVQPWMDAYPAAQAFACPGLEQKRADVRWSGVLGDVAPPLWREDLEQVFFSARSLENEVVFFHARSRTLVSSDIVFNLSAHPSRLTRVVAWILGNHRPGATYLEHVMLRDRVGARAQIERMLAWDFDRILLAHGEPVMSEGREVLRRAYAWVLSR